MVAMALDAAVAAVPAAAGTDWPPVAVEDVLVVAAAAAAAADMLHPVPDIRAGSSGSHLVAAAGTDRSFRSASILDRCWFPAAGSLRCLDVGRTLDDSYIRFPPPVDPAWCTFGTLWLEDLPSGRSLRFQSA